MKKNLFLFLIGLFFSSITFAQVKIGERPENLHTGSVLELESTTRALVITRATTLQMNIITPLAGALIYNTDVNCVHYYNGTEWKNLCEAENLSSVSLIDNTDGSYTFTDRNGDTTDFVIPTFTTNSTGTAPTGGLKMTRTGNNINFEVEIINGTENIQANSVTDQSISDNAIGNSEMKDNSVGTAEIINKTIKSEDIEPGLIGNQVLSTNATGTDVVWAELDSGSITGQDLTAANGSITVTDGIGAVLTATNIKVADKGITENELDKLKIRLSGFDLPILPIDMNLNRIINTADPTNLQDVSTKNYVDSQIASVTEVDGIVGNEVTSVADGTLTLSGAGTNADPLTIDVSAAGIETAELADDAVTTAKVLDANITTSKIADGAINTVKVTDKNITLPKLADGTAAGQLMQWDGTSWVLVDDSTLTITEVDGIVGNEVTSVADGTLTLSGAGTNADPLTIDVSAAGIETAELADDAVTTAKVLDANITTSKIADGAINTVKVTDKNITLPKLADGSAAGQLMQWDGTNWILVDDSTLTITEVDGIIGNEVVGPTDTTLELSGNGSTTPFTLDVTDGGINTTELADNAVTSAKVLDANITTVKIADANITTAKIADNAVTTAKVLDANITTAKIANDAVTTNKVVDKNISLSKLADGTAVGQLMQWNGTAWVLINQTGLTFDADQITFDETINNDLVATDVQAAIDEITNAGGGLNLATDDLTQTSGENRTYALNGSDLYFTGTGKFGIGSNTIGAGVKLRVENGAIRTERIYNSIAGGPSIPTYSFFDDKDTGVFRPYTNQIGFSTGGTEAIRIGNNQNVGIGNFTLTGNTNPISTLEVRGITTSTRFDASVNGDANTPAYNFSSNQKTGMYMPANDQLGFSGNTTELVRLTVGGVGIGNYTAATLPQSRLEVKGSFATPIEEESNNFTLNINQHTIIITGSLTMTLPNANNCEGRIYIIKNPDTTAPYGDAPDFVVGITLLAGNLYYDSYGNSIATPTLDAGITKLQSDGTNWQQIN